MPRRISKKKNFAMGSGNLLCLDNKKNSSPPEQNSRTKCR
jgi:hypothetical protein